MIKRQSTGVNEQRSTTETHHTLHLSTTKAKSRISVIIDNKKEVNIK